jgi:anti-sigma regulatory factor (Ser/Thr protein kinase)
LPHGYRHEAFFYAGDHEFMVGTLDFLHTAIAASEPTLVVLGAPKIRALKSALGAAADQVTFADMAAVGANPARIIPAWQDFTAMSARPGRRLRGIGEPIWATRSPAELSECQRHEALLNVAFAEADPDFWLMCPYDTNTLDREVLDEAARNHPYLRTSHGEVASRSFPGVEVLAAPFAAPMVAGPPGASTMEFATGDLHDVRAFVSVRASRLDLDAERVADLVLAVDEIATNSIRHGQGAGTLRMWTEGATVICEVRDRGRIVEPLADRTRADEYGEGGRGLWIANQLCDLVQIRTFATGSVVRLHMRFS